MRQRRERKREEERGERAGEREGWRRMVSSPGCEPAMCRGMLHHLCWDCLRNTPLLQTPCRHTPRTTLPRTWHTGQGGGMLHVTRQWKQQLKWQQQPTANRESGQATCLIIWRWQRVLHWEIMYKLGFDDNRNTSSANSNQTGQIKGIKKKTDRNMAACYCHRSLPYNTTWP